MVYNICFLVLCFLISTTSGMVVYGSGYPNYDSVSQSETASASINSNPTPISLSVPPSQLPPIQLTFETSLIGAETKQRHVEQTVNQQPTINMASLASSSLPPHTLYSAALAPTSTLPSATTFATPSTLATTSTFSALPAYVASSNYGPAATLSALPSYGTPSTYGTAATLNLSPGYATALAQAPTYTASALTTSPKSTRSVISNQAQYQTYYIDSTSLAKLLAQISTPITNPTGSSYANTINTLSPYTFYGATINGNQISLIPYPFHI